MNTAERRIKKALELVHNYGQCNGESPHQTWIIDQMVRALVGPRYEQWVKHYKEEDGDPAAYEWDTGVPP